MVTGEDTQPESSKMQQNTESGPDGEEDMHGVHETVPLIAATEESGTPEITCVCSLEDEEKVLTGWPELWLMSKVCTNLRHDPRFWHAAWTAPFTSLHSPVHLQWHQIATVAVGSVLWKTAIRSGVHPFVQTNTQTRTATGLRPSNVPAALQE
jgi:hypothetical protein